MNELITNVLTSIRDLTYRLSDFIARAALRRQGFGSPRFGRPDSPRPQERTPPQLIVADDPREESSRGWAVRLPGPGDLIELTPAEGRARARALVLADLGRFDGAERSLLRAMRGRPDSGLRADLNMVRDHRAGRTRGASAAGRPHRPDLTNLEYSQVDRQHEHHVGVQRIAQACATLPLFLLAVLTLHAVFGWTTLAEVTAAVVAVLLRRRTRDPRAREVRRGLVQAIPALRVLMALTLLIFVAGVLAVHLVLLDVSVDRRVLGVAVPPALLSLIVLSGGLLAGAWRWCVLLGSPPAVRGEHRSLWAEEDPIATTSNWTHWRGLSTVVLLVLGCAAWKLFRTGSLDAYAGVPLVAAGAPLLPHAATFWIRRLRGSRSGGFPSRPDRLDQLLALVPLGLIALGFVM